MDDGVIHRDISLDKSIKKAKSALYANCHTFDMPRRDRMVREVGANKVMIRISINVQRLIWKKVTFMIYIIALSLHPKIANYFQRYRLN